MNRGPGLLVAAGGAALTALVMVATGVASLVSGHGSFSWVIAGALVVYGLLIGLAAWGLWRRRMLARGPVLATGVINFIVAASMVAAAPVLWLLVVLTGMTTVAAALPSTAADLHVGSGGAGRGEGS